MSENRHYLPEGKVMREDSIKDHEYVVYRTTDNHFLTRNTQAYEYLAYVDGELIATSTELREQNPEQIWPTGLENRAIGYIHGLEGITSPRHKPENK